MRKIQFISSLALATGLIGICAGYAGIAVALRSPAIIFHDAKTLALSMLASIAASALVAIPGFLLVRHQFRDFARGRIRMATAGTTSRVRAPMWAGPLAHLLDKVEKTWSERVEAASNASRQTEIHLRVAEHELDHSKATLESIQDAVVVCNEFGEITSINAAARRLFGIDDLAELGQKLETIVKSEQVVELIHSALAAGVVGKVTRTEQVIENSSKEPRSFDVSVAGLPGHESMLGGVVTIFRDITREIEISRMKSEFVSQASHELRTPISSINAYAELLIDGEIDDDASRLEFSTIIKAEAERVARMVDNMLNISRIESGIQTIERADVDFTLVAKDIIETMTPQAEAKSISLALKTDPLVYSAEADRDMIHQVIMNLVSNGIKYTPEGGRVTVSVENDATSSSLLVSVTDTGLGIPPDACDKVFDKFYRIESYKRVAKGTGLGLNLVKHIVESLHHGEVGVESQVGMGSRFWFTVPYSQEEGRRAA